MHLAKRKDEWHEKEKTTGSSSCHGSVFPSLPNGNRINPI